MKKEDIGRVLAIAFAITITYKTENPVTLTPDDVSTLYVCMNIFYELSRIKKAIPMLISNNFVIEFMFLYLEPYTQLIPDPENK